MKQLFIYILLCHGGVIIHPVLCIGQVVDSGNWHYNDSLYRHILLEDSAGLSCRFSYPQGGSAIQLRLGSNSDELSRLDVFIRSAFSRPEQSVERIRLTGYSSIDGNYSTNEQLSRERVESFRLYLYKHYPELASYPCDLAWVGEDWGEFARLVKLSDIDEKAEVLEIIRKVPDFQERERLLVKLNGGRAYHELDSAILPLLRRVEIQVEYCGKMPRPVLNADDSGILPPSFPDSLMVQSAFLTSPLSMVGQEKDSLVVDTLKPFYGKPFDVKAIDKWLGIGSIKQRKSRRHINNDKYAHKLIGYQNIRFALKTNALLWTGVQSDFKHTAPVANIALEYYINRNWSVEAGAMYSYWNYNSNIEFQGLSGYRLEPRFRLPIISNRLEAFVGVYGRVGDYDIRKRSLTPALSQGEGAREVTTASYTGKYYDMGLSAGLSIQLVGSLGIEFGARAGYVKTKAAMYTHENGENWFDEYKHYNKIKVTDLNVSLVYRLK